MDQDAAFETSDSLIEAAAAVGVTVTKQRLARWHRGGCLPTPIQQSQGRGLGSESRYPLPARSQLLALVARDRQGRMPPMPDLAWDLWCEGFPIPEPVIRRILETLAQKDDVLLDACRQLVNADHADPSGAAPGWRRAEKALSHARFRRGWGGPLLTVRMRPLFVELLGGEAVGPEVFAELERVLSVPHDPAPKPTPATEAQTVIRAIQASIAYRSSEVVRAASWEELLATRDEALAFAAAWAWALDLFVGSLPLRLPKKFRRLLDGTVAYARSPGMVGGLLLFAKAGPTAAPVVDLFRSIVAAHRQSLGDAPA